MIGKERVLGVIPARGGSKGVPGKNIRSAYGRPLIAWTIDAAKQSKYLDRIIVSTDSQEIASVALKCGAEVPFMRPAHLAADDTPGIAPVIHALDELPGFSWVVLLQPTSPLREAVDIDACLQACVDRNVPACVSMTPSAPPELAFRANDAGTITPLLGWEKTGARRQDLSAAYALNGAVYVARVDWLRVTGVFLNASTTLHVMPPERSLDIDTEFDFKLLEAIKLTTKGNSHEA